MKLSVAISEERCSLQVALAAEFLKGLGLLDNSAVARRRRNKKKRTKRQTGLIAGYETVVSGEHELLP